METFKIDAYSAPESEVSMWCAHWQCHSCGQVLSPEKVDFSTHCPLHNPMRCTGRTNGRPHGETCMTPVPGSEVFAILFDEKPSRHIVIGRIPRSRPYYEVG